MQLQHTKRKVGTPKKASARVQPKRLSEKIVASRLVSKDNLTKVALIGAAKELFTSKGYSAVGTRELATKARVNLGAIQYHFGSKAQLFIETVKVLMAEKNSQQNFLFPEHKISNRLEAAEYLCLFIRGFLDDIFYPVGPDCCRMIFREILDATASDPELYETLINSVVCEFVAPVENSLAEVIRILQPNLKKADVYYVVQSIVGQCAFYFTHRPFVTRSREIEYSEEPHFTKTCLHIAEFSMRGIGVEESLISLASKKLTLKRSSKKNLNKVLNKNTLSKNAFKKNNLKSNILKSNTLKNNILN